ncbi:MAG: T9SS type A sorting domain-containing protein [Bacteroidia bacterium]|nr:T9SS type A sorting domain-containing protein [Bacteroidia bacterium]
MRKFFILCLLCLAAWQFAGAQACNPNMSFPGPGIDPDSATNFAPAYANSPYAQLITIVVPQDTQVLPWPIPPIPWDSTVLIAINGLPPGFTYSCYNQGPGNQTRCSWKGNTRGCVIITGNPTINDTGTYNLSIPTANYVGGSTTPTNFTITYYKIVVNAPSGVNEMDPATFEVLQNAPNPFSDRSDITFISGTAGNVEIRVYNMVGTEVGTYNLRARQGKNKFTFDAKGYTSGVYMYSLTMGDRTVTRRMVINR